MTQGISPHHTRKATLDIIQAMVSGNTEGLRLYPPPQTKTQATGETQTRLGHDFTPNRPTYLSQLDRS